MHLPEQIQLMINQKTRQHDAPSRSIVVDYFLKRCASNQLRHMPFLACDQGVCELTAHHNAAANTCLYRHNSCKAVSTTSRCSPANQGRAETDWSPAYALSALQLGKLTTASLENLLLSTKTPAAVF